MPKLLDKKAKTKGKGKAEEAEPEVVETEVAEPKEEDVLLEMSEKAKAATVVAALGADSASNVYKYFTNPEVEKMTIEVAKLPFTSAETTERVLDQFLKECLAQKVSTDGGVEYARAVLVKAYGEQAANEIIKKMSKQLKHRSLDFLAKMDVKTLYSVLQRERPQATALVLSYCEPEQAAALIAELPEEKRIRVVESIALLESASPEVISMIEQQLLKHFDSTATTDFASVGGIEYIAGVMNHMDRANEKYIFDEMSKENPTLSEEIRKRMFVFEDILSMNDHSVQRFIRDCEQKDIVYALKNATPEMMGIFFKNMSSRMAENIQSDLEITFNLRLRDVEEAQQRIVEIIRKLDEAGEVIINKGGGKGDMLV